MKLTPRAATLAALIACSACLIAVPMPAAAQAPAATFGDGQMKFLDYTAPLAKSWEPQPRSSEYRAAQFRAPAALGATDGEIVVFYFGKGQGGSVEANTARWASQFTTPEGRPVTPRIQKFKSSGIPVTMVELNGNYARGVGTGPQGAAKPNQTLLVAVIETPDGNVTLQLHGDRKTVEAHRKSFDNMVKGFRRAA
jgi:hypothetical protein